MTEAELKAFFDSAKQYALDGDMGSCKNVVSLMFAKGCQVHHLARIASQIALEGEVFLASQASTFFCEAIEAVECDVVAAHDAMKEGKYISGNEFAAQLGFGR